MRAWARTLPGGRAAVDRQHVAHGRAAVADSRVEGAEVELEAAAVALVDRRDEGVEAAALAVDFDDVALGDPLGREPPRRRPGRWGSGEEARLLHGARTYRAARTASATAVPTRRCSARFSARSVRTCSSVVPGPPSVRSSASRRSGSVAGAS